MSGFANVARDAQHEADCMQLDLRDLGAAKTVAEQSKWLNEAIKRHAVVGILLRSMLSDVSHRQCVLSIQFPASLGGGHGPEGRIQ